jgi:hypothetical protein
VSKKTKFCVLLSFCVVLFVVHVLCVASNDQANSSLPPCNADHANFLKNSLVPNLIKDEEFQAYIKPRKYKNREVSIKDVSAL